ncbi:MAG: PEPxxWA-CTERM sorting domain-containing protein [Caulobacterales bacterium]|nr:PEPxxWA-CTERM sorting domain-containing protein [Caulobacterales bacterium]
MARFAKLAAFAAGLALAAAGAQAQAATWLVTYTASSGAPASANLTVEVADLLNAVGGHDVLGITGDVDGDAITGVITNPVQPFQWWTSDGLFIVDNVLYPTAPSISNAGLFFAGASGNEYNLFSDSASTYELYRAQSGVGYLANSIGAVALVQAPRGPEVESLRGPGAVPEPASWALMILGFGAVGAALRSRRVTLPA